MVEQLSRPEPRRFEPGPEPLAAPVMTPLDV
jgi:hypothetical protein